MGNTKHNLLPKNLMTLAAVIVGVCLTPLVHAEETVEDSLVVIEAEIDTIVKKSERLKSHMTPGKGFFTEDEAVRRYQDMVYLYLIGEFSQAAEGFFALVTTRALGNTGLHWDAEWYLAESLFQMRNGRSAEQQYRQIFEAADHPFRDDAIRRLLEIYVGNDDLDSFYALYEGEIVSGRVKTSDRITYTVGRAFFGHQDYLHAKTELDAIDKNGAFYFRALYIRGAIAVAEGDLEYAESTFKNIISMPIGNSIDRDVWDLSQLALGRISMELGNFKEATTYYEAIAGDSKFLADKLYELVWALIKQKQTIRDDRMANKETWPEEEVANAEAKEQELVQDALRRVEIFLLAYPEHSYTAQLKLLRGHLHLQALEYEDALISYEDVIVAYAPVKEQFGTLAESDNAPGEYFERILRMSDDNANNPDRLPAYALAMVMADRDLGRAITVYQDLGSQRDLLQRSETLIEELEAVFGDSEGIGGFERIRYDVAFQQTLTRQKQLELLAIEESWLKASLRANDKNRLSDLEAIRGTLQDSIVQSKTDAELANLSQKIKDLKAQYKDLRQTVNSDEARVLNARLDGNHTSLDHARRLLEGAGQGLGQLETSEMERLKGRFQTEVTAVAEQRQMLAATTLEAERVSVDLTRAGFGRLEDFFAESLLRADVGIIDVYWAQKIEISEEKERVLNERLMLKEEIQRRFDLIEQKMKI